VVLICLRIPTAKEVEIIRIRKGSRMMKTMGIDNNNFLGNFYLRILNEKVVVKKQK
jgi:hypothetical protein